MTVHETAIVSSKAIIHHTVSIGPYSVIGEVVLGEGCVVHSHVVIADGAVIGDRVEIFPGALVGKEPKGAGAIARQPIFERQVEIGSDCSIGPHAIIYYDVKIGSSTLIGDGASIREQCKVGSGCIISRYVTINYNTTVGDRTKIMDGTHITGNAVLGNDVFVSLLVGTANDNFVRAGYGEHVRGPSIGDRVVVGAGAMLMPGIVIGEGATIAAGSVVAKDVEAGTLVAGSPSRLVRRLEEGQ